MTEAPERIWRVKPWTPDQAKHGLASWTTKEEAGDGATEYVRADTLPASPAPVWRVKPLEWKNSDCRRYQIAQSASGDYEVGTDGDGWWAQCDSPQSWDWTEADQLSEEWEAKEAAQSEHERRILSAILPTEQPPQADVQVAAAHVLASGFNSETNQRIATAMALVLRADIDPSAWNTDCELLNAFSAALRALAGEE